MITTTDNAPRVCACPDCLGLALDDGPLCADCTAGETGASAVWMRALLDCERAAVHAARGRIRTLPADGYTGPLLFGACA